MPNKNTFSIKAIREIIEKYAYGKIIDPFANSNKIAVITNDLDPQFDTDYHMEATDFLKTQAEAEEALQKMNETEE